MKQLMISIDPGTYIGWALFWNDILYACGRTQAEKRASLPFVEDGIKLAGTLVLVEVPIMYDTVREKNPNSVLRNGVLSGDIKGLYSSLGAEVEEVCPARKWKGGIPKPEKGQEYLIERRLMKQLTEEEKVVIWATQKIAAKLDHNMIDAVAMGRWKIGTRT